MRMRRRRRAVVGLLVVAMAVAATGCGGGDDSGGSSPGGSRGTAGGGSEASVYGPGDSIEVAVGQTFVIELEANPTTGYMWTAEANDNATFVRSRQVTDSTLVGAPGVQQLTFEATKAGSSTLVLNYARSFEADTPPAQTESFPLTVT